jgi:hypothetical protein
MIEDNQIEQWTFASAKCENCTKRHLHKTYDFSEEKTKFRGGLLTSALFGPFVTVCCYILEQHGKSSRVLKADTYLCEDVYCAIWEWHNVAIKSLKHRLVEDLARKVEREQEKERKKRRVRRFPRGKKKKRTLH